MAFGELILAWRENWPQLFKNILWSNMRLCFMLVFFLIVINLHLHQLTCTYLLVTCIICIGLHVILILKWQLKRCKLASKSQCVPATKLVGPYFSCDIMNAERYRHSRYAPLICLACDIRMEKHWWPHFYARWCTNKHCDNRLWMVGPNVSWTLAGTI